jgi:hypothetical protein
VTPLPPLVESVVDCYLRELDQHAPGVVEGLYLTGSVALGDFRPGVSDVDFVAVTSRGLEAWERAGLRWVHAALATCRPRPYFDGVYLTWSDLQSAPAALLARANVHEGKWKEDATGVCNPITWHELAWHGLRVRGPEREDLAIWTEPAELIAWTRRNMTEYWRPWHARARRPLSKLALATLGTWAPAWGVLGVARQQYTIATGRITSKYGAGLYARDVLPARWHRIVDECLRIRSGSGERSHYANPLARRREALELMEHVMYQVLERSG